jgi:phosphate-selective porin OprO/OprP
MVVATLNNLAFAQEVSTGDVAQTPTSGPAAASQPASQPGSATAEQRLQRLEERQTWLEAALQSEKEATQRRIAEAPIVGAGSDGFYVKSANGDYALKLRGYIQADGRFVEGQDSTTTNDKFLLRRVRPILEGTVAKYVDFKIMPDFGDGKTKLQDAYLDLKYFPQAKIRVGKFKSPFGLERLQSSANLRFVERALPDNLAPNRDIGLMVHGDLFDGLLNYQAGIFNGVADGGSTDSDTNGAKELAVRMIVNPFKNTSIEALQGLGVGAAVTHGNQSGSGFLPSYKTAGRETFFKYRSGVEADGDHTRVSPQAYYYYKSFGLLGEWIQSSQEVTNGSQSDSIANSGWQVAASYLLTGEKASYKGVNPIKPFDPGKGGWGAWEIAARYSQLDIGSNAFPIYADPSKSAESAQAFGVGVNWYLNKNMKVMLDYERTGFSGGSSQGNRDAEQAAFVRFQVSF